MAAKITDVARACEVSVATVSRALRNTPGVAPSTRQRIRAAAEELGYAMSPTSAGRSLGSLQRVAVAVLAVDTWFFSTVLTRLIERLDEVGLGVEVYVLRTASARNAFFATRAARTRTVGTVLVGLTLSHYELDALKKVRGPCVGLHTNLPEPARVGVDDLTMGRLAARHLIGLGHRQVAMICSAPSGTSTPHLVSRRRSIGFWQAIAEAGIEASDEFQVLGQDTAAGGAQAMGRLLSGVPFPTAVFVHSDEMALGALAATHASGLSVPYDLTLISIDDQPLAEVFGLTTIHQDVEAQADATADLLVRLLRRGSAGSSPDQDAAPLPEPFLVIRSTTARPSTARLVAGQQACARWASGTGAVELRSSNSGSRDTEA